MEQIQDLLLFAHNRLATTTHLTTLYAYTSTLRTLLLSTLSRLAANPDIPTILTGLLILVLSLKLLDLARRALLFWVGLFIRLVVWSIVVVVAVRLWSRGLEGTMEDAQGIARFWWEQYEFWSAQAEMEKRNAADQGQTWVNKDWARFRGAQAAGRRGPQAGRRG